MQTKCKAEVPADLEQKALAATPGPWVADDRRCLRSAAGELVVDTSCSGMEGGGFEHKQDQEYVAAAHPQAVLALIRRIQVLEQVCEAAKDAFDWIDVLHQEGDNGTCGALFRPPGPCDCGAQEGIDAKKRLRETLDAAGVRDGS
jgi:hypothetical protein